MKDKEMGNQNETELEMRKFQVQREAHAHCEEILEIHPSINIQRMINTFLYGKIAVLELEIERLKEV